MEVAASFFGPEVVATDGARELADRSQICARAYREHADFVWRLARRLGLGSDGAEDVVQDTFLVVHRRIGDFEGRSSLRTWLAGIAVRVARKHRTRTAVSRRRATSVDDLDSHAAGEDAPRAEHERREGLALLDRMLQELDEERREVLVLAEIEQCPIHEIAAVLGISTAAVNSRLRAAREAFEAALRRHRARDGWRVDGAAGGVR